MQLPRKEKQTYTLDRLTNELCEKLYKEWNIENPSKTKSAVKAYEEAEEKRRLRKSWKGLASYDHPNSKSKTEPWDDPLTKQHAIADNTYVDQDETGVYRQKVYPEMPVHKIIDAAIERLKTNKNLNIARISLNKEEDNYRLVYKVISNYLAPDLRKGTQVEIILGLKAFKRFRHEMDTKAKLSAALDTNDYIVLRIAYILYKLTQMESSAALKINLNGIFTVVGHTVKPLFHI